MEISEDFAYFLGVMCGDGYISPNGLIEIKAESSEYIEKIYCGLVQRLFSIKASVRTGRNISNAHGSTYYRSYFCSRDVSNRLNLLGLRSPKTFSVNVPEIIKDAEDKVKVCFIRGVFDADGSISTKKNKNILNYPTIALSSRSQDFVCGITNILVSMDMNAKSDNCMDRGKPRYQVRLYGFKELKKYMEKVSFSHPKKLEKANKLLRDGIIRGPVDQR